MDTSGFYRYDRLDTGELFFGPNFVDGPNFSLRRENMDDRNNDLNGSSWTEWFWFDTEEEAIAALVTPWQEEPADPPVDPEAP